MSSLIFLSSITAALVLSPVVVLWMVMPALEMEAMRPVMMAIAPRMMLGAGMLVLLLTAATVVLM